MIKKNLDESVPNFTFKRLKNISHHLVRISLVLLLGAAMGCSGSGTCFVVSGIIPPNPNFCIFYGTQSMRVPTGATIPAGTFLPFKLLATIVLTSLASWK